VTGISEESESAGDLSYAKKVAGIWLPPKELLENFTKGKWKNSTGRRLMG
jgi:hypothetical protein